MNLDAMQSFAQEWGLVYWCFLPTYLIVWAANSFLSFVDVRAGDVSLGPFYLRAGWWKGAKGKLGVRDVIAPMLSLIVAIGLTWFAAHEGIVAEHPIIAGFGHAFAANAFHWIRQGKLPFKKTEEKGD